jgi:hypothetical protein
MATERYKFSLSKKKKGEKWKKPWSWLKNEGYWKRNGKKWDEKKRKTKRREESRNVKYRKWVNVQTEKTGVRKNENEISTLKIEERKKMCSVRKNIYLSTYTMYK